MKGRHILLCTLAAAAAVVVLSIVRPDAISQLDLRAYDSLIRRAARPQATSRVSIVAIDEKSIAEIGQWPWRRDVLAQLVDRLANLGADVIALDVILSEPDRYERRRPSTTSLSENSASTDAALASALKERQVVTSYAFTFDRHTGNVPRCVLHPLQAVRVVSPGQKPSARPFAHKEPEGVVCSLPIFSRAAGASGFLNVTVDRDGVVRRVPMVLEYEREIYPSLSLAAVERAVGARGVTLTTSSGRLALGIAARTIPLDPYGRLLIHFPGPGGTIRYVGVSEVLEGRVPAGAFAGQIVFVGGTAVGVRDQVATPVDTTYPGIELHATAADSLLGGHFIALPPSAGAYDLGASVAAALAVAAFTTAGGLLWGGIGAVVTCALIWGLVSWAIETRDMFLSPVTPMLSAVMSFAVLTVATVVHERRRAEKERQRRHQAQRFFVQSLTSLTETRDADTGRHARRTQAYTRLVAGLLARSPRFRGTLTRERVELMAILAPLHDIGKVGIPDAVLNKPGPLTPDESAQMQAHPHLGYTAIANAEALSLIEDEEIVGLAKEMVFTHHEWWDGHGYPRGLMGEEIPIEGRILAVVDMYDALVTARPYRAPMSHQEAVGIIRLQSGTHFDPDVVEAFVSAEHDIEALSKDLIG